MPLLGASNGCMGEKFEDLVAKICRFVISDIIKVVGTAKVTKSNLHNFWYRCLVIDLVLIRDFIPSIACLHEL